MSVKPINVSGKLLSLFGRSRKRQFVGILAAIVALATAEVLSVFSILPFLSLASDPGKISQTPYVSDLSGLFSNERNFLIALAAVVMGVMLFTSVMQVVVLWLQQRFAWSVNREFSERLVTNYLHAPYGYFLSRNTADLKRYVQTEVENAVRSGLIPFLTIVQKSISAGLIVLLLIFQAPGAALLAFLLFGGSYLIVFWYSRRKLKLLSSQISTSDRERYHIVTEAFGSPKLTKLAGLEEFFLGKFRPTITSYCDGQSSAAVYRLIPKYCLEAIAFSAILLFAIYLIAVRDNFSECVPLLGLFAFAGYRLMPSLQAIYGNGAGLKVSWPRIEQVLDELSTVRSPQNQDGCSFSISSECDRAIDLKEIAFQYSSEGSQLFDGLSLTIPVNSVVGFLGSTGVGKTTLVDLILGLLAPTSGQAIVFGHELTTQSQRWWQSQVGYVPQEIYLADSTLAENIAYGDPEPSMSRIKEAASLANVSEFIESLPEKYQTEVGERGVRISGGQKQRIGIARALYRNPKLLVFDEATSSLDTETEGVVMEAIYRLAGNRTIILIAHRLSTLRDCTQVYRMEEGGVLTPLEPQDLLT